MATRSSGLTDPESVLRPEVSRLRPRPGGRTPTGNGAPEAPTVMGSSSTGIQPSMLFVPAMAVGRTRRFEKRAMVPMSTKRPIPLGAGSSRVDSQTGLAVDKGVKVASVQLDPQRLLA